MKMSIPRRAVLGLGPVTLASCRKHEPYFGKSTGADYADSNGIFDALTGRFDGSGWVDAGFDKLVDAANAELDNAVRMRKLATCEKRLLNWRPS
ncbi:MAG TPA: hypothetical protein VE621_00840 [Bryobacteraceae bacterium]|nr:hypothetical protein [Bryobacteraceae bacterium]